MKDETDKKPKFKDFLRRKSLNFGFLSVLSFRTATTHIKRQLISSDNSYQATTHIKRQLIPGDNSYQFGKTTTHINLEKRQLISIKTHQKIYSK